MLCVPSARHLFGTASLASSALSASAELLVGFVVVSSSFRTVNSVLLSVFFGVRVSRNVLIVSCRTPCHVEIPGISSIVEFEV